MTAAVALAIALGWMGRSLLGALRDGETAPAVVLLVLVIGLAFALVCVS